MELDERGLQRWYCRYEDVQTPYEKLKLLPDVEQNLKASVTIEKLNAFATQYSDNEAAGRLRSARKKLFFQSTNCNRLKLKGKRAQIYSPYFSTHRLIWRALCFSCG